MRAQAFLLSCLALCMEVTNGRKLDTGNALACQNEVPQCSSPPTGCRVYVIKDRYGCPTECGYSCGAPWCGLHNCPQTCDIGFMKNYMGCNTCECKDPCEKKACGTTCKHGYVKDALGCQTCNCKQGPSAAPGLICHSWMKCPRGVCENLCTCKPNCYDVNLLPDNPNVLSL